MNHLSPALYATLAEIVPDLHVQCAEPWCLIGSTAALLLGASVSPADVDVLTSRADAETLMRLWASRREPVAEDADMHFRSHFARFRFPGVPVEVMGDLAVNTPDGWQAIQAGRLVLVGVNGLAVPVPAIDEQLRILASFGRDKDLRHAAALRALAALRILPVVPSSP